MAVSLMVLLATSGMIVSQAKIVEQTEINHKTEIAIIEPGRRDSETRYYRVIVNPNSAKAYQVVRRFNDFKELYNEVSAKLYGDESFAEVQFPHANVVFTMSEADYEHRREQLEKWLRAALDALGRSNGPAMDLKNFLDPVGGDAARESGIMLPQDNYRMCWKTYFYGIQVTRGSRKSYTIYRRYNQFDDLKNKLGSVAEKMVGAPFPLRGIMAPVTEFQQEERRKELLKWLQEIVKSDNPSWKDLIDKFLDPDDAKRAYLECIAQAAGGRLEDLLNFEGTSDCNTRSSDRREEL